MKSIASSFTETNKQTTAVRRIKFGIIIHDKHTQKLRIIYKLRNIIYVTALAHTNKSNDDFVILRHSIGPT